MIKLRHVALQLRRILLSWPALLLRPGVRAADGTPERRSQEESKRLKKLIQANHQDTRWRRLGKAIVPRRFNTELSCLAMALLLGTQHEHKSLYIDGMPRKATARELPKNISGAAMSGSRGPEGGSACDLLKIMVNRKTCSIT